VAKEFNLPLETVLNWPLSRTLEYVEFLKIWYSAKYGKFDDVDGMDNVQTSMPKIPNKFKSKMPKSIKGLSKIGKYGSKRTSSMHGSSGHTLKFK